MRPCVRAAERYVSVLNWIDIALLVVLGLSTLVGLWRGFVVEVMSLAVWVAAFWLAFAFGDEAAALFEGSVAAAGARLFLGYAMLFVGALLVGGLATWLMGKLVKSTGLSGTDRLLGLGFGLARGARADLVQRARARHRVAVEARLQRAPAVTTPDELRTVLTDGQDQFDVVGPFSEIHDELTVGESARFSVALPLRSTEAASLDIDEPGVYPLLVNVNGTPEYGGAARLDDASFLLPVLGVPADPTDPGTGAAHETGLARNVVNAPLPPGAASAEWRAAMEARVLPALDAFAPELILVSAGFDAHEADPLAQMALTEEDFAWAGRRLRAAALQHCQGKLVSTLEGGYDLPALARSAAAYLGALQHG